MLLESRLLTRVSLQASALAVEDRYEITQQILQLLFYLFLYVFLTTYSEPRTIVLYRRHKINLNNLSYGETVLKGDIAFADNAKKSTMYFATVARLAVDCVLIHCSRLLLCFVSTRITTVSKI
jgi:hypothetical protein